MKKICLLFYLLLIPLLMVAQDDSRLKFSPIDDKTASVSAQNEDVSGDVVIPSKVQINGSEYIVTAIADNGFKFTKITSILLPSTLEVIGKAAFFRCLSLKNIVIPPSVKVIDFDAFYFCSSLEDIHVIQSNPMYRNVGKAVVDQSDIMIAYPGKGDEKLIIPEVIKGIRNNAISGCASLKEVFIPSSVRYVGDMAFLFCLNLQRVHWNASTPNIPFGCFQGCQSLEEIIFSEKVSKIEGMAFYGTALRSITVQNSTPIQFEMGNDYATFGKFAYENTTVYVPSGSLEAFRSDAGWGQFTNMEETVEGGWHRTLIVSTLDGGTMEYLLDKQTKVRIEQPNLVIETDGTVLTYELQSLSQIRYGRKYITTGIHGETVVNGQAFRMEDGVLLFDNLRDNSLVEVFTVDGKTVMSRHCSGRTSVTLDQFGTGVYFVKVNGETYKILKK